MRVCLLASMLTVLIDGAVTGVDPVKPKPVLVNPTVSWYGDLAAPFPEAEGGIIERQVSWEQLWKAAKLPGPCPRVEFSTHIVVVTTHIGWTRVVAGWLSVDEKGTAKSVWWSQPERIAGSYGVVVLPRVGIKSVNGR